MNRALSLLLIPLMLARGTPLSVVADFEGGSG